MTNSLEERLKTHSTAFDGLLSLIPAKYYYDDATQDQWQQKKKSKKETAQNKQAKLDPESASTADTYNNGGASAKDVMDLRAKEAKEVTLPGKKVEAKEVTLPEKVESKQENGKETEDDFMKKPLIDYDDEGNESQATKSNQKKILSPAEIEERKQRRAQLKEKLANKITMMREKRKAPGSKTGGPAKSREQMLAERKKKQEDKRQEKLKRKREADDEEQEAAAEESDSEEEDDDEDAVLFGTIQFKDGTRMTSDLKSIRSGVEQKKKKGPANNDIKGHLLKLEAKRRKLEQLSPEDRKKRQELDQWKSLMDQAEGVKVKNDEKLLKRALKRKDKQKLKSEIQWKERKQNVKDTIAAREKRRDANLKARRDNKGKKGKNQPKLKKFTGTVRKGKGGDSKKRAGFEGNAKSKGKKK